MTLAEAESLFQQGKYDEAAKALGELAAKDPFTAVPRLRIGQMHFRFRRFSEAAAAWDQLYDALVEKPSQLNDEVDRLGAEVLTVEDLLPFGAQYPPIAQVSCLIGDAYLGLEDWNHSLTAYGQALKAAANCLPGLKGQAQCHIKLREFDKARRELLDYLEENPRDAKAYRLLALVARSHGWHDQQMNLLHCALLIAPGHLKSLDSVSRFLEQQNRLGDALRLYREALEIKGESPELLNNVARLELEISKQNPVSLSPIKRAITNLEKSLTLEPNQTQIQMMLTNLREVEQQTAPMMQASTAPVGLKPPAGIQPPEPDRETAEALHFTSSAILSEDMDRGTPQASAAPDEPVPAAEDQLIVPAVSKPALSVGLAESINMLPPWERESQSRANLVLEEENVEPVSLGLEVTLTPEKIAELIEKAKNQENEGFPLPVVKPKPKLFAAPPESVQALQPNLGPLDIAKMVQDAQTDAEGKPAAYSPTAFKPSAPPRPPGPPAPGEKYPGALKPIPAMVPLAAPRAKAGLQPRVDRKLLRTPVKRAAPGRKGAKSEMLSAWQLKVQVRTVKA